MPSKEIKHYTIEEILTYLDCSLCHHIQYNLKITPPAKAISSQRNIFFKESIHNTIAYYYRNHKEGKPPDLKYLYSKFLKTWTSKNGNQEEISILTRPLADAGHHNRKEEATYIKRGYDFIQKFFHYNNTTKQSVLAYNYYYELPLKDIIIEGEIPLIREVELAGRRELQLVIFSTSQRVAKQEEVKANFKNMIHAFAFQQILNIQADRIVVYYMAKDTEVDVFYSRNDFQRLFNTLESFLAMVNHVKPFPTTSVHTYSTLYKELCDNYNYEINPI